MQKQQILPIISAIRHTLINLLAILFQPYLYLVKKFFRVRTLSSIAKQINNTTAATVNIGSSIFNIAKVISMPINIKNNGKSIIIFILLSLFNF